MRHLFTVEEYHRIGEAGLLAPDQRVELLRGEIIEGTPIGSGHASTVDRLTRLLVLATGDRAVVRVQGPVQLSELSEPQPDLALLRPRSDFYQASHPGPADVFLLVEVADTTRRWDRTVKRPLYAGAGIPEVWIVDLAARVVEVCVDPAPEGYRQVRQVPPGASVSPVAFADLAVAVADILG